MDKTTTTPTSQAKFGGGGYHPLLAQHLQQSPQQPVTVPSSPAVPQPVTVGGGGCHPAVKRHLQAQTTVGGGCMHPAVAKHLQAR